MVKFFFLGWLLICISGEASALDEGLWRSTEELLSRGLMDKAKRQMSFIESKELDPSEQARLAYLKGLLELSQENPRESLKHFTMAQRMGYEVQALPLNLARAAFLNKDYQGVFLYLKKVKEPLRSSQVFHMLSIRSHLELGHLQETYLALGSAKKSLKNLPSVRLEEIRFYLKAGLFQKAKEVSFEWLQKSPPRSYLKRLALLWRDEGPLSEALKFFEALSLRFADQVDYLTQTALLYVKAKNPLAAARFFEKAAQIQPRFYKESAELYKRSGRINYASYQNQHILDQKIKLRQRLGFHLFEARYHQALAMEKSLSRYGLIKDDDIRYALAYSAFQLGSFQKALDHLALIRSKSLDNQVLSLREQLLRCQKERWQCAV